MFVYIWSGYRINSGATVLCFTADTSHLERTNTLSVDRTQLREHPVHVPRTFRVLSLMRGGRESKAQWVGEEHEQVGQLCCPTWLGGFLNPGTASPSKRPKHLLLEHPQKHTVKMPQVESFTKSYTYNGKLQKQLQTNHRKA